MKNASRNVLIGIAYIVVLMLGMLAQSAQACAEYNNVKTFQVATGPMPCHLNADGYSVNGSKCLFADQAGSDMCITQAWMPLAEVSYLSNPEPVVVGWRPEIVPAFQTSLIARPTSATIRHSRRSPTLAILYCSFQI